KIAPMKKARTRCVFSAIMMLGIEEKKAKIAVGKKISHCLLAGICKSVCKLMGMATKLAVKIACNKKIPILSLNSSECLSKVGNCRKSGSVSECQVVFAGVRTTKNNQKRAAIPIPAAK